MGVTIEGELRPRNYSRRQFGKTVIAGSAATAAAIVAAASGVKLLDKLVNEESGLNPNEEHPVKETGSLGDNLILDPLIQHFTNHRLADGTEGRFPLYWTPIVNKPERIIRSEGFEDEYADNLEHTSVGFGKEDRGKNVLSLEVYTEKTEYGEIIRHPSWRSDIIKTTTKATPEKEYQFSVSYKVDGNDKSYLFKTKPVVRIVPLRFQNGQFTPFGDTIEKENFPIDPLKWHHDQGFKFRLPDGSTHFVVELSIRDYSEKPNYDAQKRMIHFAHPFVGEVIIDKRPEAVTQPSQV